MFLSLEFHKKYPLYLQGILGEFIKSEDYKRFPNRVILVIHDIEDKEDDLLSIM